MLVPVCRPSPAPQASAVPAALAASLILCLAGSTLLAHPSKEHGEKHSKRELTAEKVAGQGTLEKEMAHWQARLEDSRQRSFALEKLGWLFVTKARQESDHHYFTHALACADLLSEEFPGRKNEALLLRGHIQLQNHQFALAEKSARILVDERGSVFDYALLGDTLLDQGQIDRAAQAYQKMADLRPGMPAYLRAGELRWLKGDVEGCLEMMTLAVQSGSQRQLEGLAWAHSRFSHFLLQSGRTAAAGTEADRALKLLRDYAPALRAKAFSLMAELKWAEAADVLASAAHHTSEPGYLWPLWECLSALDRREEAAAVKTRLMAAGEELDRRTFALFLATIGEQKKDAVRMARAEIKVRRDPYSLDALAWALFAAQGDAAAKAESRELIREALDSGILDPRILLHATLIHAGTGHNEAASAYRANLKSLQSALYPSENAFLVSVSMSSLDPALSDASGNSLPRSSRSISQNTRK